MTARSMNEHVALLTQGSTRTQLIRQTQLLFPLMPRALIDVYVDAWIENDDPDLVWAQVEADDRYDEFFPGNRRDDGTIRWSPMEYWRIKNEYRNIVASVGINPDIYENYYGELFGYEKSPKEFADQVDSLYERVVLRGDEYLEAYRQQTGVADVDLTTFLAGLIHNDIHDAVLDQQITTAEIQGEAFRANFGDIGDLAERLEQVDLDREGARRLFGDAVELIPAFSVLARRHADPDDDFDLEEFAGAAIFNDPTQSRRMRRLIAQERSLFNQTGGIGVTRDRSGGLVGLTDL